MLAGQTAVTAGENRFLKRWEQLLVPADPSLLCMGVFEWLFNIVLHYMYYY